MPLVIMDYFTLLLYQPLLNALVLFYYLIGQTSLGFDMGYAVILLTILIRIILLPITLAGHRSESERREIAQKVKEAEEYYRHDPVAQSKAVKQILRAKPRIIISEATTFLIQAVIALTLWRIFSKGLLGEDLHLLYSWMPQVAQPYNLNFLGRFDLTHPDWILNLIQAFLIFVLETIAVITSPYYVSRKEVVRVQLILPVVSFLFFAFMPAGKKLFVVVTLLFSLAVVITRLVVRGLRKLFPPAEDLGEQISSAQSPTPVEP
jgi:YidC/Oxa1 family membrane protein insertase